MAHKTNHYAVLFRPLNGETVQDVRVIDSWTSTGNLTEARAEMHANFEAYKAQQGDGFVSVIPCPKYWRL
jgi:hypothetical protein